MWTLHCAECGAEKTYTNKNSFYQARKKNTLCKPCSKKGDRNPFKGQSFSKKQLKKWSNERSGSGNPMFGTDGGHFGKHHTESAKQKISERHKKWWKEQGANPTEFARYRWEVDKITARQPLHLLEHIEKRGKAGVDGAYHLDHIRSVWYGFHNNIPPEVIGDISNLQMLPWLENQRKWLRDS